MTNRFKGFLVTLDADMREDDAESVINALKMIKRVRTVLPYISHLEDKITERRALLDAYDGIIQVVLKKRQEQL